VLHGQSSLASQKECDKAAKIVAKGHPEKKQPSALQTLAACGPIGAQALATGMNEYRTETDTGSLAVFMRAADRWRDANIMNTAIQLASDPSATVESRVFALRHITGLVNPYFLFDYAAMIAGRNEVRDSNGVLVSWTLGCPRVMRSWKPNLVGTPLPADYRTRIQSTIEAIATNTSLPAMLRNATQCADFSLNQ
jgi:hypothetical protein